MNNGLLNNDILLLSKFSHELKTPLHGVMNMTSLLKENWNSFEDQQKIHALETIFQASEDMLMIINHMLDSQSHQKNIQYKMAEINLSQEVERVVRQFARLYEGSKNIQISFTGQDKNLCILADKFWLGQVIINLLANAYNYSDSGKIEVSVQASDDWYYLINVKDQGKGIPKNCLESIFLPYNKGDSSSEKSSGLGLNICYEIVNAHGGKIVAKNNDDCGATIEIKLPKKII